MARLIEKLTTLSVKKYIAQVIIIVMVADFGCVSGNQDQSNFFVLASKKRT